MYIGKLKLSLTYLTLTKNLQNDSDIILCFRYRSAKINDYISVSQSPGTIISSTGFICVHRLLESADTPKSNLKLLKPFYVFILG